MFQLNVSPPDSDSGYKCKVFLDISAIDSVLVYHPTNEDNLGSVFKDVRFSNLQDMENTVGNLEMRMIIQC